MPLYEIHTTSTFENVYIIEANNYDEACFTVLNDGDVPDFYQKHLGEVVQPGLTLVEGNVTDEDLVMAHKSIRDQGFC